MASPGGWIFLFFLQIRFRRWLISNLKKLLKVWRKTQNRVREINHLMLRKYGTSTIRSSQTTLNRIHIIFFSTVNMVQVQKETKNHGVERQLKRSIIRSKLSRQLQNHMVISWPESRHFWRKTATSNLCGNFSKPPLYDETFEKMANLKKMLKMRRAYAPPNHPKDKGNFDED